MSGPLGSLPGFWYDPQRKKYFPGVAPALSEPVVAEQTLGIRQDEMEAGPSRLARPVDSRIVGRTRATVQSMKRTRISSAQLAIQKSITLQHNYSHWGPEVKALACTTDTVFVGEDSGVLSSLTRGRGTAYNHFLSLSGPIVDIHIDNGILLASSFGPSALRLVRDLKDCSTPTALTSFNERHDVWCQSLKNGAATFGGNGWIAHATKVGDEFTYQKRTKGGSDALSLAPLDRDNVYAGHRSGDVVHYDFRVQSRNLLLKRETPVANLRKIDSVVGGLVVAGLRNELSVYDVRFAKDALLQFAGHRNKHSLNLAVSSSRDDQLILAAGSDCRVRAWSTATGDLVTSSSEGGPLDTIFDAPVSSMAWCEDDLLIANGPAVDVFTRGGAGHWKWDIV